MAKSRPLFHPRYDRSSNVNTVKWHSLGPIIQFGSFYNRTFLMFFGSLGDFVLVLAEEMYYYFYKIVLLFAQEKGSFFGNVGFFQQPWK